MCKTEPIIVNALFIVVLCLIVLMFWWTATIPTVVYDVVTKKCMKVISSNPDDTCYNIPKKYNKDWGIKK